MIERIRQEVRSPRLREELVDDVEAGLSLSNPEASKVYELEKERGPSGVKFFQQVEIPPHAQYRMDQRGVTVSDVRLALTHFVKELYDYKSQRDPRYQLWTEDLARGEILNWTDKKLADLTLVFKSSGPGAVRLITTYWKGEEDPRPMGEEMCKFRQRLAADPEFRLLKAELNRAPEDFWSVRTAVLDRLYQEVRLRIMRSGLDLRVWRSHGTVEYNLDKIEVQWDDRKGQYQVEMTPGPTRHLHKMVILARSPERVDPRKLADSAFKVYRKKFMDPDIEKIEEHLAQKAQEEARLREEERLRKERLKSQAPVQEEEDAVWSVARTGYDVGGDAEEDYQGYVAEVDTFSSKSEAISHAKSIGGGAVMRGTQMENEPLGQIEESNRPASYRYYR